MVLTLRATDSGEPITSVQIIDAKFIGTDSTGIVQGMEIITVQDENAVLNNVLFVEFGGSEIYYKQIFSDGGYTFDDTEKSIVVIDTQQIIEIANSILPVGNFIFTDVSFPNLPIIDGQIIIVDNQQEADFL